MGFIEIAIFAIALTWLVGHLSKNIRYRPWKRILPILAIVLILVNFLRTRHRWQMLPIAVFVIVLIVVDLIQSRQKVSIKNKTLRIITIVLSFLAFTVTLIFPLLLPVVDLPKPNGPYAVGTVRLRMTDTTREEIFTTDPDDLRSLLVTAWYPAEIAKGERPVTYWDQDGITGKAYSFDAGMGTFWYSHISDVRTNSFAEAPISLNETTYPVVIYSHSFAGLNTENTMLFEELASQGYIVFSLGHTYETIISIFPDGKVIGENYNYIFELYESNSEREEQLYQDFNAAHTMADKRSIIEQILTVDESMTNILRVRTDDVLYVLDELETLNSDGGIFDSRLDLDRVGIMGWSFGGATALEACLADQRFSVGINIDGWPYGEYFSSDQLLSQPFMVINSEPEDETERIVGDMVFQRSENVSYRITIENAQHTNFWDFPLFFDVYKYFGYWGSIDAFRLVEINSTYIIGFFDKSLKGQDVSEFGDDGGLYPEMEFEVRLP